MLPGDLAYQQRPIFFQEACRAFDRLAVLPEFLHRFEVDPVLGQVAVLLAGSYSNIEDIFLLRYNFHTFSPDQ
jgi:hypothetical protein